MATHSSTLARKIPWMEKSGRLQSMGSQRVRHDWETSLSLSLIYYINHLKEGKTVEVLQFFYYSSITLTPQLDKRGSNKPIL